jgi:DNA-binding transcriptional ArsR family regulator
MQKATKVLEGEKGRIPLQVIVELLSALSSPDSLKIFMKTEKGIINSTRAIRELGLTQKRYYVWLKRLIDAGLVEKKHGRYRHTLLGKVCAKLGRSLQDTLLQGERLELANTLLNSATLSAKEKTDVLHAISKHGSQGLFSITDILHSVKTIVDYNIYINDITQILDSSKKSAYLAINKMDSRISDAIFNGIDRGVTFFILSTEIGFSENLEFLKLILNNPKTTGLVRKFITKEMNIKVVKSLDYCFIVSDEKRGLIEFPHPLTQDFYAAFRFENPYLCNRLIDIFHSLYEGAKEDPRIAFIKKTLGLSTSGSGKI